MILPQESHGAEPAPGRRPFVPGRMAPQPPAPLAPEPGYPTVEEGNRRPFVPGDAPPHAAPVRSHPPERAMPERPRTGSSDRERLLRILVSPEARRQAYLLREVLGPPVALRGRTADRPS